METLGIIVLTAILYFVIFELGIFDDPHPACFGFMILLALVLAGSVYVAIKVKWSLLEAIIGVPIISMLALGVIAWIINGYKRLTQNTNSIEQNLMVGKKKKNSSETRFKCPNCQTTYSATTEQVGHDSRCKKCGVKIVVPNARADSQGISDACNHNAESGKFCSQCGRQIN